MIQEKQSFEDFLFYVAQDIASLAPASVGEKEVLKKLQTHFYPYEQNPEDEFANKIKEIDFSPNSFRS